MLVLKIEKTTIAKRIIQCCDFGESLVGAKCKGSLPLSSFGNQSVFRGNFATHRTVYALSKSTNSIAPVWPASAIRSFLFKTPRRCLLPAHFLKIAKTAANFFEPTSVRDCKVCNTEALVFAGERNGLADVAGFAGPQGCDDDADLHARHAEAGYRGEKPVRWMTGEFSSGQLLEY